MSSNQQLWNTGIVAFAREKAMTSFIWLVKSFWLRIFSLFNRFTTNCDFIYFWFFWDFLAFIWQDSGSVKSCRSESNLWPPWQGRSLCTWEACSTRWSIWRSKLHLSWLVKLTFKLKNIKCAFMTQFRQDKDIVCLSLSTTVHIFSKTRSHDCPQEGKDFASLYQANANSWSA